MYKFLAALIVLMPSTVEGQSPDLGSWNVLNIKYTLDNKWSIFGEAQLRSLKFYNNFHYYEYKGGLSHKIYNNVNLTIGAGSYQTYREGGDFVLPKNNDEFRLFPQIILSQAVSRLTIEQRYRAEFRFASTGYRNRFRYRLGLAYPFGKNKNGYSPCQVSISNEVFFTDKEPYFERNRFQMVLNYKTSESLTVQLGYLHQFDYKINDETGRNFLIVGFYYELFRKSTGKNETENQLKDN